MPLSLPLCPSVCPCIYVFFCAPKRIRGARLYINSYPRKCIWKKVLETKWHKAILKMSLFSKHWTHWLLLLFEKKKALEKLNADKSEGKKQTHAFTSHDFSVRTEMKITVLNFRDPRTPKSIASKIFNHMHSQSLTVQFMKTRMNITS